MSQLHALMREARQSGELESALAATSAFPVPKRASRATVPVADFNVMKASMPRQVHVQVEQVTPNTVTIKPKMDLHLWLQWRHLLLKHLECR